MKSYEEMARYVLEVRDEHEKKKRRIAGVLRICVPAVTGLCAAVIIGLAVWKNMPPPDKIPSAEHIITTETSSSEAASSPVSTAKPVHTSATTVTAVTKITSSAELTVTSTAVTEYQPGTSRVSASAIATAQTKSTAEASTAKTTGIVLTTTLPDEQETVTVTGGNMGIPYMRTTTYPDGDMGIPSTRTTTVQDVAVTEQQEVTTACVTTGTQTVTTDKSWQHGGGTMPWSMMTIERQYDTAAVEGYGGSYQAAYAVNPKYGYIAGAIGTASMSGYDSAFDEVHTCKAIAYHVNGLDDKDAVAIQFSGNNNYYLYCRSYMDKNELMNKIRSINQ